MSSPYCHRQSEIPTSKDGLTGKLTINIFILTIFLCDWHDIYVALSLKS